MASFFGIGGGVRSASVESSSAPAINQENMFELVPMSDKVDDAMYQYTTPGNRPQRPDPVDYLRNFVPEMEDLDALVKGHSWRTLALASRSVIVRTSFTQYNQALEGWVYRIHSLIRLGHYELANIEVGRLERLSKSQLVYQEDHNTSASTEPITIYHPIKTWPWELRVMRAQIPGLIATGPKSAGTEGVNRHILICKSIDRTHALIRTLDKKLAKLGPDSPQKGMYRTRRFQLVLLLSRQLLELKDVPQALKVIRDYISPTGSTDNEKSPISPHLLTILARIHINFGDLKNGSKLIKQAEDMLPEKGFNNDLAIANRAFLLAAQGKWSEARKEFEQIVYHQPLNFNMANNMAICDLYQGNLDGALSIIDDLLTTEMATPDRGGGDQDKRPRNHNHSRELGTAKTSETLLYNYCSCLELRFDDNRLVQAKAHKLSHIASIVGDGFNVKSLKLEI
ncbi:hypothetical protein H4219_002343 [Mycoemilia scoparia]|uniref:Trafficking protein particle complex subunit 12 n=1 Tax=Mycoemilia scoparia TaxID=417184 RepID=A0A9W7ZYL7_9FUNG|nr:hypothetical protein H4219_002343 [Mycoemilia scoparia]